MITSKMMSLCCRTVSAVSFRVKASVLRKCSQYNNRSQRIPADAFVWRLRSVCTAAAADGVALSSRGEDRSYRIRQLSTLNDWIYNCGGSWQELSPYEGLAAIRKLVEVRCGWPLLLFGMAVQAAMSAHVRRKHSRMASFNP
jgi:hypothetical protein